MSFAGEAPLPGSPGSPPLRTRSLVDEQAESEYARFKAETKRRQAALREDLKRKKAMVRELAKAKTQHHALMRQAQATPVLWRPTVSTVYAQEVPGPRVELDVWKPYRKAAQRKVMRDFYGDDVDLDEVMDDRRRSQEAISGGGGGGGGGEEGKNSEGKHSNSNRGRRGRRKMTVMVEEQDHPGGRTRLVKRHLEDITGVGR